MKMLQKKTTLYIGQKIRHCKRMQENMNGGNETHRSAGKKCEERGLQWGTLENGNGNTKLQMMQLRSLAEKCGSHPRQYM
jgi:hypothetical protein